MTFVLGLGDSISHGIGDTGGDCVGPSWSGRLAHRIGARREANLSFPGAQSGHLLHLQAPAAAHLRPDVVLLTIGGNDVLRGSFDPLRLAHDVKASLALLDEVGARVVLLGLPDPRRTVPAPRLIRDALARRTWAANRSLDSAVAGGSALVLHTWDDDAVYEGAMWHVDRLHPSPRGHEYLAGQAIRALGLDQVNAPLPTHAGRRGSTAWLVRNGSIWLAKRSVDLLPGLARMCLEAGNAGGGDGVPPPRTDGPVRALMPAPEAAPTWHDPSAIEVRVAG